jgi:hypothetical protein
VVIVAYTNFFFKYSGVVYLFYEWLFGFAIRFYTAEEGNRYFRNVVVYYVVTMEKVQINVSDKVRCMVSRTWYEPIHGRTTSKPDLTTFPQPRHIPTRGYNITQSSASDDWYVVARNMLSNY